MNNGNATNRRKTARTTVHHAAKVDIRGKAFLLKDISSEGFGIAVTGPDDFYLGQRISSIRFAGEGTTFNGVVSHVSKNDQGFVCGICFIFESSREFEAVKHLVKSDQEN